MVRLLGPQASRLLLNLALEPLPKAVARPTRPFLAQAMASTIVPETPGDHLPQYDADRPGFIPQTEPNEPANPEPADRSSGEGGTTRRWQIGPKVKKADASLDDLAAALN